MAKFLTTVGMESDRIFEQNVHFCLGREFDIWQSAHRPIRPRTKDQIDAAAPNDSNIITLFISSIKLKEKKNNELHFLHPITKLHGE